VLVHAVTNVAFFVFPDYGSHYDPMVTGIILTAVVVVIVLRWGGRTLASQRSVSL